MANRTRDVSLVIRAKDEATKAINSITAALADFGSAQSEIAAGVAVSDSALSRLSSSYAKASVEVDRVAAAVARSGQAFSGQQRQLEQAKQTFAQLQKSVVGSEKAIVDLAIAMRAAPTAQQVVQIEALRKEQSALSRAVKEAASDIVRQSAALQKSEISYRSTQSSLSAATLALTEFGDEASRSAAVAAAAAARTTRGYLEQAKTARALVEAEKAQASFGVSGASRGPNRAIDASASKSARESAATLEQAAIATRRLDDAALKLKNDLNPLIAVQAKFNERQTETKTLFDTGRISLREYVAATGRLKTQLDETSKSFVNMGAAANSKANNKIPGVLGLRPYELQNLSFQINDIFTQLGSGTSVSQTLAQQSGQIFQLFQKQIVSLGAALPAIGAFGAAIAVVATALSRLAENQKILAQISADLVLLADGSSYSATSLTAVVKELQYVGIAGKDAAAALKIFTTQGVNPQRIDEFADSARKLARVQGLELPEAAKLLSQGLTGNYEDFARLSDSTVGLSDKERKLVKDLFESGRSAEARSLAFKLSAAKINASYAEIVTVASETSDRLSGSWQRFLDSIARSNLAVIVQRELTGALDTVSALFEGRLAVGFKNAVLGIAKSAAAILPGLGAALPDFNVAGRAAPKALATGAGDTVRSGEAQKIRDREYLDKVRKQQLFTSAVTKDQKIIAAGEAAVVEARNSRVSDKALGQIRIMAQNAERAKLSLQGADSVRTGSAGKAESESQRQLKAQNAFNESLLTANEARIRSAASARTLVGLEREALTAAQKKLAIEEAIEKVKASAREKNVTVSPSDLDRIAFSTGAAFDAEQQLRKSQDQQKFNEALALENQIRQGSTSAQIAVRDLRGEELILLDRKLRIQEAITAKEKEAFDNQLSFGSQQRTDIENSVGAAFDVEARARRLAEAERVVNDLLTARSGILQQLQFAQSRSNPGQTGLLATEYENLNLKIRAAADSAAALYANIGGPEAGNAILNLQNISNSTQAAQNQFIASAESINLDLINGAAGAFDSFAQSVASGANVFGSLKDAFLSFAADFLRQIAQMIIQQAIFNALGGGGGSGGSGGSGSAGGLIGGFVKALFLHGGGKANSGATRQMPAAMFAEAARYHSGTGPGLKPGEVPAVLLKNERVLTEQQSKGYDALRAGQVSGGQRATPVNIVNTIDSADFVSKGMATRAGSQAVVNVIRDNRSAIKAALE